MHLFRWARESTTQGRAMALLLAACLPGLSARAYAYPFPMPHHGDHLHREIEALEEQWRMALIRNDVATVSRLLADDYLGINPNGTLETKADAIAARRSGVVKIASIEPDNIKVRVYGDTAVVTSKVDVQGHDADRDISGLYRYTRVYSHRTGEWKIVSFEASRLQPKHGK